ncbi:hypothetical protein F0562_013008 [Nyssa sinensis]|uniref:Myb-like domain-containing protein n=1 Tax=Nyssa sinensis TaxID=561372 RepID=A0A5J4ZZV8_9ASTE|nr:hypothetical protein F0562_013008 [Nyssa sinensis]
MHTSVCPFSVTATLATKSLSKVRKGSWTEEDVLLRNCIQKYGEGKWHQVPLRAGNVKDHFDQLRSCNDAESPAKYGGYPKPWWWWGAKEIIYCSFFCCGWSIGRGFVLNCCELSMDCRDPSNAKGNKSLEDGIDEDGGGRVIGILVQLETEEGREKGDDELQKQRTEMGQDALDF